MTTPKPRDRREQDLRLAIFRIERGRAHSGADKVNFSTVAREVGVTPALIHNHYPKIARLIRDAKDAAQSATTQLNTTVLQGERAKNTQLRRENEKLRADVARLATINEMLLVDIRALRAAQQTENVSPLRPKKGGSR